MSSFGGSSNNYQSNPFGGGGGGGGGGGRHQSNSRGGGRNSNYRGGRNNRSGGRGRGRGRGRGSGGGRGASSLPTKFQVCKDYSTEHSGPCTRGNSCNHAHVIRRYGVVTVTGTKPTSEHYQGSYPKLYAVNSVAVWETSGGIKLFTGSDDGFWRLWNTSGGSFAKEFESNMNGAVTVVKVVKEFLFCAFESISTSLPEIPVGMVHVWNLNNASAPPMELQHSALIPYAHNQSVTALEVDVSTAQPTICTGSRDGSVRVWTFSGNQFQLVADLPGHAREVRGLVYLPANKLLWSCGIDGAIRIWDVEKKACQYSITCAPAPNTTTAGPGHTNAVTDLCAYQTPSGTFILSSSLDGMIKAWNATTGECVASESNGEGIVNLVVTQDAQSNQLLLLGAESGAILIRNLQQTPKVPAFGLLSVLHNYGNFGHHGACNDIVGGPSATFYTVGADGKLLVCQFTGDLQIK